MGHGGTSAYLVRGAKLALSLKGQLTIAREEIYLYQYGKSVR